VYERLAVCMWASVSMRRAALCAALVSSWGGTVRNARVLHVACRFAKTARLRATSFAWGLRRPAICFLIENAPTPDPEDWRGGELSPAATRDTLLLPHPHGRRTGENCLSKLRRVVVTV